MLQINKLYFGDCLQLMKKIDNKSIGMILCDLPYGITAFEWDICLDFEELFKQYNRIIKDNGCIALTAQQPFTTDLINSYRKYFRYEIIWEKSIALGFFNANKMPLRAHENVLIFYKKLPTYNPQFGEGKCYSWNSTTKDGVKVSGSEYGGYFPTPRLDIKERTVRYPRSVWKISNPNRGSKHGTQKPLELFERLIKTYTNECDLVLDNCIGSGTTAIACVNTNRNWIGMEKNPKIFLTAKQRINEYLK